MIVSKPNRPRYVTLSYGLGIVLVVCGLGTFLFPFSVNDKASAKKTACLSNLKQIDTAVLIYASDHNDALPPFYTFDGADTGSQFQKLIKPYSKSEYLLICPAFDHPNDNSMRTPGSEGILGTMSYVHSLSLRGIIPGFADGTRGLTLYGLNDPEHTAYMRDPVCGFGQAKDKDGNSFSGVLNSAHGGGFNIAFLDGHVRNKTPIDIHSEL